MSGLAGKGRGVRFFGYEVQAKFGQDEEVKECARGLDRKREI